MKMIKILRALGMFFPINNLRLCASFSSFITYKIKYKLFILKLQGLTLPIDVITIITFKF